MSKHPHEALIRAWMDGHKMQYLEDATWRDMPAFNTVEKMPHWYAYGNYRRKPLNLRYRVGLDCVGGVWRTFVVETLQEERERAARPIFHSWVSEWQNVAV